MTAPRKPLAGVRVLDFSTLLPGPMATLILAEAGAEVIKVERPGTGEDMRQYPPMVTADSGVNFALLNRGKRSLALDLKDDRSIAVINRLIADIDVVVEQFRPGVMDRLGLGWEALAAINPALVYCSITGWGQDGPKAQLAAHDLNYMAETGVLNLGADRAGDPVLPPVLVADIGGGTFPSVVSILLALREAERTGVGAHLDVAMGDNLFAWAYWALGERAVGSPDPRPGGELVTGGSPRYQVYRCADGRWLACAPLEPKFWVNFCRVIDLPEPLRERRRRPGGHHGGGAPHRRVPPECGMAGGVRRRRRLRDPGEVDRRGGEGSALPGARPVPRRHAGRRRGADAGAAADRADLPGSRRRAGLPGPRRRQRRPDRRAVTCGPC